MLYNLCAEVLICGATIKKARFKAGFFLFCLKKSELFEHRFCGRNCGNARIFFNVEALYNAIFDQR